METDGGRSIGARTNRWSIVRGLIGANVRTSLIHVTYSKVEPAMSRADYCVGLTGRQRPGPFPLCK